MLRGGGRGIAAAVRALSQPRAECAAEGCCPVYGGEEPGWRSKRRTRSYAAAHAVTPEQRRLEVDASSSASATAQQRGYRRSLVASCCVRSGLAGRQASSVVNSAAAGC